MPSPRPSPSNSSGGDQRRNPSVKPALSPICPQSGDRQDDETSVTVTETPGLEVILASFNQAEREGFEPSVRLPAHRFSRHAHKPRKLLISQAVPVVYPLILYCRLH